MLKKILSSAFLFFCLTTCYFLYLAGLGGDFLFDDYPNLELLGTYGTIDSWDKFYNFLHSGFAGPTGRPIALASFLLDANTWPTTSYPFKYTNLMLHLLNGALLAWAALGHAAT